MAVDMFIRIGTIKGESKDHKHKEEIDVLAWSWSLSNSGSAHVGGGAGSGKVSINDLSFTHHIDKASTELMLAACNGKHFPDALLTVRKAGEKVVEYLKIKMTDVLITSVMSGGAGGSDRLNENVTLNFAKVHVDYTPQKQDGSADKTLTMGWDIAANIKA